MSNKGKYIGIESRVQYEILEAAIYDYLSSGTLDNAKCLSHIKQYNKGDNRARKILKHITVLLGNNAVLLETLSKIMTAEDFAQLNTSDRKGIILCLFCNSFPITYDILFGFAQVFKVQDIISKEVIVQKIGAMYGSNRSMQIAITEIIPLLIECGTINRIKIGIYSKASKLLITNKFVAELIIYTDIKLSGSKSILIDDLGYKPWYTYFDLINFLPADFNMLLSKKESAIGKGYFTLKSQRDEQKPL